MGIFGTIRVGAITIVLLVLLGGCASILKEQTIDFKTTELFWQECERLEKAERAAQETPKKKSFFVRMSPLNMMKKDPKDQMAELRTTVNDCAVPNLERMIEQFRSIQETDEKKNILGATRQEVREKGFSVYTDKAEKLQRQNTRTLRGSEALAEVGMPVSPPPLQKPEEIKAYGDFMGSHYGEQYFERGLKKVVDRVCINNDESLEIGVDYSFVIVWRGDHVFRRVIKGGPINNPKKKSAFLTCPAGFIGDLLRGGVGRGINAIIP